MPRRILISGAAGYIGRKLCAELSSAGHHVIGAMRSPGGLEITDNQNVHSWLCPPIECTDFAVSLNFDVDVVIHLAAHVHQFNRHTESTLERFHAVNVVGTENIARLAIRQNASLFILASTVAVYGDRSGAKPLSSTSPINPITPYAQSKLAAENVAANLLTKSNLPMKVLRIPMVYGRNAPGNFSRLCKLVATGIPLPLANATSKRSLLFVSNLTHAIQAIIASPKKCPRLALITDNTAISTADLVRNLARTMQSSTQVFPFPRNLLELASHITRQHESYVSLFEPMEFDSSEFRSSMNWSAPYDSREALTMSVPASIKPQR